MGRLVGVKSETLAEERAAAAWQVTQGGAQTAPGSGGWRSGTGGGSAGLGRCPRAPQCPARGQSPQRRGQRGSACPQPAPGPAGGRGRSPGARPGWGCPGGADPRRDGRSAPPLPAPPRSGGARARGDNFPRSFRRRAATAVPTLAAGLRGRAAGKSGGTGGARLGGSRPGQGTTPPVSPFSVPFPAPLPCRSRGQHHAQIARLRTTDRPSYTAGPCGASALPALAGSGCHRSRRTEGFGPAGREGWGRGEGNRGEEGCWRSPAALPVSLSQTPRCLPPGAAPRTAAASERQGVRVFRGWPARPPPVPALPPYPQTTPSPLAPVQPLI